jgi:hypothetical protein
MHIRHHSLYTPRDFDLSPYFQIVKPTLVYGFDYKSLSWAKEEQADKKRAAEAPTPSETAVERNQPRPAARTAAT